MAAISGDRFGTRARGERTQVVEGLHGVPFAAAARPLTEYLDVLDLAFAGRPLEYHGSHYSLPRPGGEGKVLRLARGPGPEDPGLPGRPSGRGAWNWPCA